MRFGVSILALSAGVSTGFSAGISAGTAWGQAAGEFELGTIVLEAGAKEAGEGKDVEVTAEDLNRIQPADLQDLFKGEPTVQVGSSIPMSQKVYVNGVEETNLAVTVDGSRQNNKIFHHNATTLIDPALLKSVRVAPGVAPADAGPGAMAGSIAYETRDVGDMLSEGDDFGGFLSSSYESNGNIFTNAASVFGRQGGFEALGYLKYATGGDREDGGGNDILASGTDLLSGLVKLAYEAESGHRIELSYERVNDDDARPYRGNLSAITAGRPVPATRRYDLDRQNVVLSYSTTQPTEFWNPTARIAYSVTDLATIDYPNALVNETTYGMTDSLNGEISNQFSLGSGTVDVGLDFYEDSARIDYRSLDTPAWNYETGEAARNIGLFVQARFDLSERARVSFGGRHDWHRFEGVDGSTSDSSGFSGNLSGEYDLSQAVTLAAGYSHVWAGPTLAENYIANPGWTYPAEGLRSMEADNIYVALGAELGAWSLRAKLFQTEIENARTPSYGGGADLYSDVETRGYELSVGYSWGAGFARLAFADIDTEINDQPADSDLGRYLTTPIGQILSLAVAHEFAGTGLRVGGDAQVVFSEVSYDPYSGTAGQPLDGYEVVNAFLEYQPRGMENVTIRGEVNNLFDAEYVSRATYGQEFGTVVPLNEPGRSFKIEARVSF